MYVHMYLRVSVYICTPKILRGLHTGIQFYYHCIYSYVPKTQTCATKNISYLQLSVYVAKTLVCSNFKYFLH
jgi:hypothetical protein